MELHEIVIKCQSLCGRQWLQSLISNEFSLPPAVDFGRVIGEGCQMFATRLCRIVCWPEKPRRPHFPVSLILLAESSGILDSLIGVEFAMPELLKHRSPTKSPTQLRLC
jgi:hypothetical protein